MKFRYLFIFALMMFINIGSVRADEISNNYSENIKVENKYKYNDEDRYIEDQELEKAYNEISTLRKKSDDYLKKIVKNLREVYEDGKNEYKGEDLKRFKENILGSIKRFENHRDLYYFILDKNTYKTNRKFFLKNKNINIKTIELLDRLEEFFKENKTNTSDVLGNLSNDIKKYESIDIENNLSFRLLMIYPEYVRLNELKNKMSKDEFASVVDYKYLDEYLSYALMAYYKINNMDLSAQLLARSVLEKNPKKYILPNGLKDRLYKTVAYRGLSDKKKYKAGRIYENCDFRNEFNTVEKDAHYSLNKFKARITKNRIIIEDKYNPTGEVDNKFSKYFKEILDRMKKDKTISTFDVVIPLVRK